MTATAPHADGVGMIALARDLCEFPTGVVADGNGALFERLGKELPFELLRWESGDTHNGWVVPDNWRVQSALIRRDGEVVFDGTRHTLGVARYSRSFEGTVDWSELQHHLATDPELPDAYVFHCMWQYRPWAADWAMSVPHRIYSAMGPGTYDVELRTSYTPGEMLLGQYEIPGRSEQTIVFHSNNCHPHMANDGFAGTAVLIRLFQWLSQRENHYTYRLVVGPEHLGTVFYLRDHTPEELDRIVCGVFAEMPGTAGPVKVASSFLGGQPIDAALSNAARHRARSFALVPWRQGAGNDETVWEAPGYEVPFVEVTRSEELLRPYRGYHTSLDNHDLMQPAQLEEFADVLADAVDALEGNAVAHRRFDGLVCLSNPRYDLYVEREDPAVEKDLAEDQEAWGYLLDCLLRYFDGTTTILDIAERHGLPFGRLRQYLDRFAAAGLITLEFAPVTRHPVHRVGRAAGDIS